MHAHANLYIDHDIIFNCIYNLYSIAIIRIYITLYLYLLHTNMRILYVLAYARIHYQDGLTLLIWAAKYGLRANISMLLDHNANINARDNVRCT